MNLVTVINEALLSNSYIFDQLFRLNGHCANLLDF